MFCALFGHWKHHSPVIPSMSEESSVWMSRSATLCSAQQADGLWLAYLTLTLSLQTNLVAYFFEIKQERTPSLGTARRKVLSK
jgi:hypothetical protein